MLSFNNSTWDNFVQSKINNYSKMNIKHITVIVVFLINTGTNKNSIFKSSQAQICTSFERERKYKMTDKNINIIVLETNTAICSIIWDGKQIDLSFMRVLGIFKKLKQYPTISGNL